MFSRHSGNVYGPFYALKYSKDIKTVHLLFRNMLHYIVILILNMFKSRQLEYFGDKLVCFWLCCQS